MHGEEKSLLRHKGDIQYVKEAFVKLLFSCKILSVLACVMSD